MNQDPLQKLEDLLRLANTEMATKEEVASIFAEILQNVKAQSEKSDHKIQELRSIIANLKLQKGDKGDSIQGEPGHTPTNRELIALIEPLIPEAPKASDIASTASKMALDEIIPEVDTVKKGLTQLDQKVGKSLEALKVLESLPTAKEVADIKRIALANTGPTSLPPTTTFWAKNGTVIGRAKNANFVEGENTSIDVSVVGDTANITVEATPGTAAVTSVNGQTEDVSLGVSELDDVVLTNIADGDILVWDEATGTWINQPNSSSGVTVETPTGSVNSSNTSFTVTAVPKWIVADGITHFEGAGYSRSSLTITMDLAPSFFIRSIS